MNRAIFSRLSGVDGSIGASLKRLIAWDEHLKVNHPGIDAQHESIFKVAMEIADIWHKRGSRDELKELTEKLAKVLEGHFSYEERHLEEVAYPKLEEHKAEHRMMLEELQVIRDRLDRMTETAWMAPGFLVHNYILGIAVGHIAHSDMDYSVFVRKTAEEEEKAWPPRKCPFCGSDKIHLFECDTERWAASCTSCNAMGPNAASQLEAFARWNNAQNGTWLGTAG